MGTGTGPRWLPLACLVVATAVGFNALAAASTLKLPSDEWSVDSDTRGDVEQWERGKKGARDAVVQAAKLAADMPAMAATPSGPALDAFTREVNEAAGRLEELGSSGGVAFSACPGMGSSLTALWQKVHERGGSDAELKRIVDSYHDGFLMCQQQIMSPPEPSYRIFGPDRPDTMPPAGCKMLPAQAGEKRQAWSCGESALRRAGLLGP